MKSIHYITIVSCVYLIVGLANLHLKFTYIEIIQVIWFLFLIIPLNRRLARKLGIKG